jgi:hypothetical protein
MHVVERIRVADDGRLEIEFTVTDPVTFNMPWSALTRYTRNARQTIIEEEVCAENNYDVVTKELFPIPVAERPDF